jgi:hypothetical protein
MLLTVLVLSVGIFAPSVVAQIEEVEAKTRAVTLSQIMKSPEAFRKVPCEFTVTFHTFSQVYNPYFTRFVPEDYFNFSAWADGQKLWRRQEYKNDFAFLFVDKRNPSLKDFLGLKRFDRISVIGSVLDTFKGMPWIEVHSMRPIPGKLTEKALIHRVRGDYAMKTNRPRIAVKELTQALNETGLPSDFVYDSTRRLGMAMYRTRDFMGAQAMFSRLASMNPDDKHAQALAAQSGARAEEVSAKGTAVSRRVPKKPTIRGKSKAGVIMPKTSK